MKYTRNFHSRLSNGSIVSATAERTPAADFGDMFRMDSQVILRDFQGHPTESVLRTAVSFVEIRKKSHGAKLGGKEGMGPQPCFRIKKLLVLLAVGELQRH